MLVSSLTDWLSEIGVVGDQAANFWAAFYKWNRRQMEEGGGDVCEKKCRKLKRKLKKNNNNNN